MFLADLLGLWWDKWGWTLEGDINNIDRVIIPFPTLVQ